MDRKEIRERHQAGATIGLLAREASMHVRRVRACLDDIVRKSGPQGPTGVRDPDRLAAMREARDNGAKLREIAAAHGVAIQNVSRLLRSHR